MDARTRDAAFEIDFSPDELRRRYLEERDKRLVHADQRNYFDPRGDFSEFAQDPYAEPGFSREPIDVETDVVVLGGGHAGLLVSARLIGAGIEDFRIIESASDFGGTWYWNRYPGVRCDVESYIYMPLLEELGYVPSEKYTRGGEIFSHCRAIGRHFGLYDKALFQTQLTSACWDEASARWIIGTDRGDTLRARFLCTGTGLLSKPKMPAIPGIRDFKGHAFHTSRWDYAYTGGDETGGLTGLSGKRVAIVGTGATAIQVIPHVAAAADHLYIFQRTPSAVDARGNRPTDPDWAASLTPGWQHKRVENFSGTLMGLPQEDDLVGDHWGDVPRRFLAWKGRGDPGGMGDDELLQLADYAKMEDIRGRIDSIVRDPATAEALKPWYNLWCKRPLFSDDYLETFNRDNVTLVDTSAKPIERVTETGIEFDGKLYEVDCIIWASGFDQGAPTYDAGAFALFGRNGVTLKERWANGLKSLHGMYANGFPNFMIVGSMLQGSATVNFTHTLERHATHVAGIIRRCLDEGIRTFEIRKQAEDAWAATLAAKQLDRAQFERECTPGVYNREGKADSGPTVFGSIYGGGPFEFFELCAEWRRTGKFLDDVEVTRES